MPSLRGSYSESGAIIDVHIGVSEPRRRLLSKHGGELPPIQRVPFLIDTGAQGTVVSEQLMRILGIPVRGSRNIVGVTTHIDPTPCDTHDIEFQIKTPGGQHFVIPALEVVVRPFFNCPIEGLIGRDVLDRLKLTMGRGRFELELPDDGFHD